MNFSNSWEILAPLFQKTCTNLHLPQETGWEWLLKEKWHDQICILETCPASCLGLVRWGFGSPGVDGRGLVKTRGKVFFTKWTQSPDNQDRSKVHIGLKITMNISRSWREPRAVFPSLPQLWHHVVSARFGWKLLQHLRTLEDVFYPHKITLCRNAIYVDIRVSRSIQIMRYFS